MRSSAVIATVIVSLWLLSPSDSPAVEQGAVDFTLAYDYSQGDYGGSSDTKIHYIPLSIGYKTFPWKFKITAPIIRISGPGNVIGGTDGGIVTDTADNGVISEQGFGDIILSSSYAMDELWSTPPYFDITTKIKLPTGDSDKFLGTGETDFSLQLDIANTYGNLTPFGALGYKIVGEPESVNYQNSVFASLGANYKLSDAYSTGLIFDYRQAVVDHVEDSKEGIVYLNWNAQHHLSVMGYAVAGFSTGSPDAGLGLQIKYTP